MAWINSFKVHGLAGRTGAVERTLDRNLNVFWGLNGAGKTTLLQILHAALKNDTSTLDNLPFDRAEVVFGIDTENLLLKRSFSKQEPDTYEEDDEEAILFSSDATTGEVWSYREQDGKRSWNTTLVSGPPERATRFFEKSFAHSYLPITRAAEGGIRPVRSHSDRMRSSDDLFVEQVRNRWRDYSLKSFSQIREIQQQGLATVLAILFGGSPTGEGSRNVIDDVDPGEAYELVRSFLGEQQIVLQMPEDNFIEKFQDSTEHRQVVAEIQTVKLQTDQVLAPQQEFQRIIDSMYLGNKHLVLSRARSPHIYRPTSIAVEINERSIPLKSLSSGEKQLLQMLLESLSSANNSVIIDEPELSLHVNWQQQLVSSMKKINGDCQLILASHSPEITAEVSDNFIFEL